MDWTWGEVFISTWEWAVPSAIIALIALAMAWRRGR